MARPFTRKLIELVDLEIVAARAALIACLSFQWFQVPIQPLELEISNP